MSEDSEGVGARRRRVAAVQSGLRDVRMELAALNHRVRTQAGLQDVDLDSLDVIVRHGPLSPSALARHIGVHAATMTGILGRLEKGGWITREPDPGDRRAVLLQAAPDRTREIFGLYAGMNAGMERLCEGYSDDELDMIVSFLGQVADAGRQASDDLS